MWPVPKITDTGKFGGFHRSVQVGGEIRVILPVTFASAVSVVGELPSGLSALGYGSPNGRIKIEGIVDEGAKLRTYTYMVTASNSAYGTAVTEAPGSITVYPRPTITAPPHRNVQEGTEILPITLTTTDANEVEVTNRLISPLPSGILDTWSNGTLTIEGTVTVGARTGEYPYTIIASHSTNGNAIARVTGTITVWPLPFFDWPDNDGLSRSGQVGSQIRPFTLTTKHATYASVVKFRLGVIGGQWTTEWTDGAPIGIFSKWSEGKLTIGGKPEIPGFYGLAVTATNESHGTGTSAQVPGGLKIVYLSVFERISYAYHRSSSDSQRSNRCQN